MTTYCNFDPTRIIFPIRYKKSRRLYALNYSYMYFFSTGGDMSDGASVVFVA